MSWQRRLSFGLLALLLLVGGSTGIAAAQEGTFLPQLAAPANEDGDLNVQYVVPANMKIAAMNYASAEAFANVPPLPWYDGSAVEAETEAAPAGEVGWSFSGPPDPNADAVARATYADVWAEIDEAELAEAVAALEEAGTEFVPPGDNYTGSTHSSFRGNWHGQMWNTYPYKTVGKLYVYENGSYSGYCSASVIGQRNIIVTAAHCTYDQSTGWFDAWAFVPADRNGAAPYGTWWANNALVRGPWTTGGGRNYDVSLLTLDYKWINSAWRPVSYYTGWLGRVWNLGYQQHLFAVGYPSNIDSGNFSHFCAAESYYGGSTDYISMGCDMTFGSSGGPWIYKFHPYRGWSYNYVDSVVSGGVPGTNLFTGPRFSSENIGSLCTSWDCGATYPRP